MVLLHSRVPGGPEAHLLLAFFGTSLGKGSGEALLKIFSDLGTIWGAIGEAFGPFSLFFQTWDLCFRRPVSGSRKGAVGRNGVARSPAQLGGGFPCRITLVGLVSKEFHTPSGQARPGAADISKGLRPTPPPCLEMGLRVPRCRFCR